LQKSLELIQIEEAAIEALRAEYAERYPDGDCRVRIVRVPNQAAAQ
jgi:hypothetical protein